MHILFCINLFACDVNNLLNFVPCVQLLNVSLTATMKSVRLPVLQHATVWLLLGVVKLFVRRVAPAMKVLFSVEISASPSHSVAVATMAATTVSVKCFIPVGNVRKNASVQRMER